MGTRLPARRLLILALAALTAYGLVGYFGLCALSKAGGMLTSDQEGNESMVDFSERLEGLEHYRDELLVADPPDALVNRRLSPADSRKLSQAVLSLLVDHGRHGPSLLFLLSWSDEDKAHGFSKQPLRLAYEAFRAANAYLSRMLFCIQVYDEFTSSLCGINLLGNLRHAHPLRNKHEKQGGPTWPATGR